MGQTKQLKQRYLCKDWRRQFLRAYTYLGCLAQWRALIVPLTMKGAGARDMERVLGISRYTIFKTLREAAAQLATLAVPKPVRALEIDECWSFVHNKQQPR